MNSLMQDARYALRTLGREKAFFVFAALIIGIGVGANTAVFSVMSPLLLRPLPFQEPDRLVWVPLSRSGGMSSVTSRTSNLRDYREMNRSFDGLTGYFAFFEYDSYNLTGDGEPERLVGVGVARDFLEVLGVAPLLGRNFVDEEAVWDGRPAAILTHGFWMRRFGGDRSVVGTTIVLNDRPTEVVGVLPATFDFSSTFVPASRVDFLTPFPITDETDRQGNTMAMIGRLRPGATVESAQTDIDQMTEQLQEAQPDRWGLGAVVLPLREHISGGFRSALFLLAAAAGTVMLVACLNLSNLLLARGRTRGREMAIRSALGADRYRLVRQLTLESLVLALAGSVVGVGIAFAVTRLVAGTSAVQIPMLSAVSIDGTVLTFTLALAVTAGLVMGVVPALHVSRAGEAATLNDASRGSSEGKRGAAARETLVMAEVALALVLLVGGGLLLRSFVNVLDVDLGFEPEGRVAWRVDTNQRFETRDARAVFYDDLIARVAALPGVDAAGLADTTPLGRNRSWGFRVEGVSYEEGDYRGGFPRIVDYRYIETMGIPLVAGRYFTADDKDGTTPVMILNQAAADRFLPGEDLLGRRVLASGRAWEIVGVVGNVRHQSLEQGSAPEVYFPYTQHWDMSTVEMVVQAHIPLSTLAEGVRRAIREVDPAIPTDDFRTMDAIVDRALSPRRFILLLLGSFAAAGLLLAALGIYAVLSYNVSQRTSEIGIRMALGQTAASVRGQVVGRTLALAGTGVLIGTLLSLALTRLIGSLLYGVGSTDAITFLAVSAGLLLVATAAGYLPARRASRTDPAEALKGT
ncbi:MAG TPA: ABC transporter permease [Longimicrobiales bacterium]|nr:ABC transporter permease [Longimicrobiales bacterium]